MLEQEQTRKRSFRKEGEMTRRWKSWLMLTAVVAAFAAPVSALADFVDPLASYFVPQSGPVLAPTEGPAAIANARTCPNVDGIQVLRNNVRLKIVVIGTSGLPMPGISEGDICVLFNGGTPAQGFTGAGDDTIIANFHYNPLANCPDVTCIKADAPTDVNGVTYITWIGSTPGSPGVGTRDGFRKWGAYAGDVPVFVLGKQLRGKLTTNSPLGTYTAHVKNLDSVGGAGVALNQGELVNSLDISPVMAAAVPGAPYRYHLDFDNNGIVNVVDINFVRGHNLHRCNNPLFP